MNLKLLLLLYGIFLKSYANELSDQEYEEQSVLWTKIVFNKLNKLLDYNTQLSNRLDKEESLLKRLVDGTEFKEKESDESERLNNEELLNKKIGADVQSEEKTSWINSNDKFLRTLNDNNKPNNWITIQRRQDPSINFNCSWTEYKNGFGDPNDDYFMGLEKLHEMTTKIKHTLRIVVHDNENKLSYANFDEFVIGSESEKYEIKSLGKFNGSFDKFYIPIGSKFSTYGNINSPHIRSFNRPITSGWWYFFYECNLNDMSDGSIHCGERVLTSTLMMIRPNRNEQ